MGLTNIYVDINWWTHFKLSLLTIKLDWVIKRSNYLSDTWHALFKRFSFGVNFHALSGNHWYLKSIVPCTHLVLSSMPLTLHLHFLTCDQSEPSAHYWHGKHSELQHGVYLCTVYHNEPNECDPNPNNDTYWFFWKTLLPK